MMPFKVRLSPWETGIEFGNYWVMVGIGPVQVGPACLALRVVLGLHKLLMSQLEASCVSPATAHPSN